MADRPLWVNVQGPNGATTVQLPVPWLVAMRFEFNASNLRIGRAAKNAAETARLYFRPGNGAAFSQLVRDGARLVLIENGR
jgi:hypothetical protein